MKCYFIRHGETESNLAGKIMSRIDEPLDQHGIEEAEQLGTRLDKDFELIFCSPMLRTKQTAEGINKTLHLQIEIVPELIERDFGSLAGKTKKQMDIDTHLPIAKQDDDLAYDYRPYGGEAVEDVKARLRKFIASLEGRPEKKVLVVTHTGILRLIYPMYLNQSYPFIANASVHILDTDNIKQNQIKWQNN